MSIYSLTIAVSSLPSAWLVERFGARAVFTFAILLFTVSSIACGFANAPAVFDAARAVQGVGGALMVPVEQVVPYCRNDCQERSDTSRRHHHLARADGAFRCGPTLESYIADAFSWRAIPSVNVPLGAIAAVLAIAWTPRLEAGSSKPFDFVGFLYAGAALASALILLDRISSPDSVATVIMLA